MRTIRHSLLSLSGAMFFVLPAASEGAAADFTVRAAMIDDLKAVIATVEPVRQLVARSRIPGTIVSLTVREGDRVSSGAEIAAVADPKLLLQVEALDSRIRSAEAQRDQARLDFNRAQELQRRGVSAQAQLDKARTALDVAERAIAALRSDRQVVVQQAAEGAVLAPGAGRVLAVPVSVGRWVLAGETVATIAEDNYILRLSLPERHAQFLRAGDPVSIAARGQNEAVREQRIEGKVRLVYPEIKGGRVIADVDVAGLGDYFVGERTRVYIATGKRKAVFVPASYLRSEAGITYVRLAGGTSVPVQPGETHAEGVEILSGVAEGDVLVQP